MDLVERSRQSDNSLMSYWLFLPKEAVEEHLEDILALSAHISSGYIWQNESFCLHFSKESDEIELPHLFGSTDYGENVSDLWFITYILKRLTLQIEGLIVKLQDSDGEFLLIEAANHLPEWVTPETATNRVYLYEGELHLIPLASSPADITPLATGCPTIKAAVQCVSACNKVTRASQAVQDSISKRLCRYPEQAAADIHSTTCYVPVSAAQLLADDPQLISSATRAFYLRDPIDVKACQNMCYFPPDNRVSVKVRLTRCLYAQLVQQKFFPPKRSIWNIPPANSPKYKSHDLGMKIAFGFEMLCTNSRTKEDNSSTNANSEEITKLDEKKWAQYLSSLHKYDYFQGEIEGSVRHQQLLLEARRYFTVNQEAFLEESSSGSRENTGDRILRQLKTIKVTEKELREAEKHLTPDDDDSWLSMTYAELDQLLEEYHTDKPSAVPSLNKKPTAEFDTQQIANSMNAFINKQSNILSGAELPTSDELKFDGKGFLAAIEQMINGEDEAALDSDDSSLNEYESDDSLPSDELVASRSYTSNRPMQASKAAQNSTPKKEGVTFDTSAGSQSTKSKESQKPEKEPKIEDFMAMMDRELSRTNVGKTFERQTARKEAAPSRPEADNLSGKGRATLAEEEDISDTDEELEPVDVDFNTVKNLLESYNHQMGLPGPTSNLIESMGVKLPQNADE
ncbi:protein ecdysoneless homolog isoform X2 [Watersipora subatra]|uniref:protein ecdysoneless homolog isoform X2 n=1 Tax=Watersipora subatra TaxID=2589382 RepID=UPI00355C0ADE